MFVILVAPVVRRYTSHTLLLEAQDTCMRDPQDGLCNNKSAGVNAEATMLPHLSTFEPINITMSSVGATLLAVYSPEGDTNSSIFAGAAPILATVTFLHAAFTSTTCRTRQAQKGHVCLTQKRAVRNWR